MTTKDNHTHTHTLPIVVWIFLSLPNITTFTSFSINI